MGILDSELRHHLERVTKDLDANKVQWLSDLKTIQTQESFVKNPEIYKSERQRAAEKFQERGNVLMKAQDFVEALRMYSESLAAAVEGPLASMAYFNRL
jgi:predicted methyltransferase